MSKNYKKKPNWCGGKGFTLVELLIVIAIVGILAAISFSLLNKTKKNTQADSACNDAAAMINKARNYALTGKCAGGGATTVDIKIQANGGTISATNDAGGSNCSESFTFTNDVTCTGGGTYTFSIPEGNRGGSASDVKCGEKKVVIDDFKATCQ